jgi:23S rRNA pseudouridine955/2504/2580 synthase
VVRVHPQGKQAISLFSPLQRFGQASLMRVQLITGRPHQIRVHARYSGHPIAGDTKYGDAAFNHDLAGLGLDRLFLHAELIRFTLPEVGDYEIRAPLDPALEGLLARLD